MTERYLLVYSGTSGAQGMQGYRGFQGAGGATGATGISGNQGNIGIQGSIGFQGDAGFTGFMGVQGPETGAQGVQGSIGQQGATGLVGPQGFMGNQGPQGASGATGYDGNFGATGNIGLQGSIGIQGDIGNQGLSGVRGIQGIQGSQGTEGPAGVQGSTGISGFSLPGSTGPQGNQGIRGSTGATGLQGAQGLCIGGTLGATGASGSRGFQGNMGATGATGVSTATMGFQGRVGLNGSTGVVGSQGIQGIRGTQGLQGIRGSTGVQGSLGNSSEFGATGATGVIGATGFQGSQGATGPSGFQGVQGATGQQSAEDPGITGITVNNTTYEWTLDSDVQFISGSYTTPNVPLNPLFYTSQAILSTDQKRFGNSSALFSSSGYLAITGLGAARFTGNWAYEFWTYLTDSISITNENQILFCTHSGTAGNQPNIAVGVQQSTRLLMLWISTNGTSFLVSGLTNTTALALNTWHHIALVWNGTNYVLYLNGTQQSSTSGTAIPSTSLGPTLILGSWFNGSTYSLNLNNGYIDEFRVSDSVRYTSNFTPSSSVFASDGNTIFLQHFEGSNFSLDWNVSQETPVVTYTPQDNTTNVLSNTITYTTNASFSTSQERFGYASAFFASSTTANFIKIVGLGNSGFSSNWTFECWVYPTNLTNQSGADNQTILSVGSSPNNLNYLFLGLRRSSTNIFAALAISSTGSSLNVGTSTVGTIALSLNTWSHLALRWNGSAYTVFVNGSSDINITESPLPTSAFGTSIMLGAYINTSSGTETPNQALNGGFIDEVRISSTNRYASNFTPSSTPFSSDASTVFLHHFNGPNGSFNFNVSQETPVISFTSQKENNRIAYTGTASLTMSQKQFGTASAFFTNNQFLRIDNLDSNLFSTSGGLATAWTYEGWFYLTQSATQTLWSITVNGLFEYMLLGLNASNNVQLSLSTTGNSWNIFSATSSSITVALNRWHHVAITYDGTTYRFYVNGFHQSGVASANRIPLSALSNNVLFGAYHSSSTGTMTNFLTGGYIDEFRISSIARYTGTGIGGTITFTPSFIPFSNDINTIYLQHFNTTIEGSRLWESSQETPLISTFTPQVILQDNTTQTSDITTNELTTSSLSEKITYLGNTNTIQISWANLSGNIFYVVPINSANMTCILTDVPTVETNIVYSFTVIIASTRQKVYISNININGISVTPLFPYGLTRSSISTANLISQTFNIVYINNNTIPWQCLSNVVPI